MHNDERRNTMKNLHRKIPTFIIFISVIFALGAMEFVGLRQSGAVSDSFNTVISAIETKRKLSNIYNKLTSLESSIEGYAITSGNDYRTSGNSITVELKYLNDQVNQDVASWYRPSVIDHGDQILGMGVNVLNEYLDIVTAGSNEIFKLSDISSDDVQVKNILDQIDRTKTKTIDVMVITDSHISVELVTSETEIANVKIFAVIGAGTGIVVVMFLVWIMLNQLNSQTNNQSRLELLSYFDQLTGLPGRRSVFDDDVHGSIFGKRETFTAICMVDVDHFTTANDTIGHANCDELLKGIAERLTHFSEDIVSVIRFGGDEFVVVWDTKCIEQDAAYEATELFAVELFDELRRPFPVRDMPFDEYSLSFSMGIVIGDLSAPDSQPTQFVRQADIALYTSKSSGRRTYSIFEQDMEIQLMHQMKIERMVKSAIENRELGVSYQPIVSNDKIIGAELLLSCSDSDGTLHSNDDVLDIAGRLQISSKATHFALCSGCKQLRKWLDTDSIDDDFKLSVNIDHNQIKDPSFVEKFVEIVMEHKVPFTRIRLEIADSALYGDMEGLFKKLEEVAAMGTSLTLDDFSSGLMSIPHSQALPFSEIKINSLTVREQTNHNDKPITMLEAIKTVADAAGLHAIVGDIVSVNQLETVKSIGFDTFQGELVGTIENTTSFSETLAAQRVLIKNTEVHANA